MKKNLYELLFIDVQSILKPVTITPDEEQNQWVIITNNENKSLYPSLPDMKAFHMPWQFTLILFNLILFNPHMLHTSFHKCKIKNNNVLVYHMEAGESITIGPPPDVGQKICFKRERSGNYIMEMTIPVTMI